MAQLSDTSPEAERVMIERLRELPPWRRLQQAQDMTAMLRVFSLAGLKRRYPQASAQELQRRLAAVWLEPELVRRAYGWDPDVEGY